jgi:hypothetical protein
MAIIIFCSLAVILGSLTVYYSLNRKVKCISCFSKEVELTGEKRYKEDPVQIMGSPSHYHELEYKCNMCGVKFWEPKQAMLFN